MKICRLSHKSDSFEEREKATIVLAQIFWPGAGQALKKLKIQQKVSAVNGLRSCMHTCTLAAKLCKRGKEMLRQEKVENKRHMS